MLSDREKLIKQFFEQLEQMKKKYCNDEEVKEKILNLERASKPIIDHLNNVQDQPGQYNKMFV